MIEKTLVNHIKLALSIVDVVGNDTIFTKKAISYGGTLKGPCPWCKGDDRFHVHPSEGNWWCRQCGRKGSDVISYWMQRFHLDFETACKQLGSVIIQSVYREVIYDVFDLYGCLPLNYRELDDHEILARYRTRKEMTDHLDAVIAAKTVAIANQPADDPETAELLAYATNMGGVVVSEADTYFTP